MKRMKREVIEEVVTELDVQLVIAAGQRGDCVDGVRAALCGANVNARAPLLHYSSPLKAAAALGNRQICQLLIDNGADCEVHDEFGWKPIHWAARCNQPSIIHLLADNSAKVNNVGVGQRRSPLAVAVLFGHFEATKALVERGGDSLQTLDYLNNQALDWVIVGDDAQRTVVRSLLLHTMAVDVATLRFYRLSLWLFTSLRASSLFCGGGESRIFNCIANLLLENDDATRAITYKVNSNPRLYEYSYQSVLSYEQRRRLLAAACVDASGRGARAQSLSHRPNHCSVAFFLRNLFSDSMQLA